MIKEGYIMFKYIFAALSVVVMGFTCLQANSFGFGGKDTSKAAGVEGKTYPGQHIPRFGKADGVDYQPDYEVPSFNKRLGTWIIPNVGKADGAGPGFGAIEMRKIEKTDRIEFIPQVLSHSSGDSKKFVKKKADSRRK